MSRYLIFQGAKSFGALNVLHAILDGVERIAENPYAWQVTDDTEVRLFVVQRYRYKIFYTIRDADTVEILHVRHTSRRPWTSGAD